MDRKPVRGSVEKGGRTQPSDDWLQQRDEEIREKERRGEPLTHSERMSLAIDEGIQ
ncbi:MAG TPA: hypothetical protein VFH78_15380 [Candidatus Thermoplasmatota archaeon]|nr:hypothetical protein [Candidatus Thermoplasmatota archaeon]